MTSLFLTCKKLKHLMTWNLHSVGAAQNTDWRDWRQANFFLQSNITSLLLICNNIKHLIQRKFHSVGPSQRAPRRPRPPTKGKQLDKMTKAMGRRLPISVEEGKRRPHVPVQAAKFASEAGIVMRESIPILPHWKDYKKDEKYYKSFVSQLSVSALLFEWYTCIHG